MFSVADCNFLPDVFGQVEFSRVRCGVVLLFGREVMWLLDVSLVQGGAQTVLKRRATDLRINLSSNELLHPRLDPILREALAELKPSVLRRYPVTAGPIADIAAHFGLHTDEFMLTPGSDSALRMICRHYAAQRSPNGTLLLQYPNYEAWEQAAALVGLVVRRIGNDPIDPAEQAARVCMAARTHDRALIAVSVPNGPGGWPMPPRQLDELIKITTERDHLLVIDSCYQAFNGPFTEQIRHRGGPVLVVQSLSKSHGLAGARLGLLCGDPKRIAALAADQLEQTVSGITIQVARSLLDHMPDLEAIWQEIRTVRADVARELVGFGLHPLPSGGNFLTVRVGSVGRAAEVTDGLSRVGYRVRDLSPVVGLAGCIRFTISDRANTEVVLGALRVVLSQGGVS